MVTDEGLKDTVGLEEDGETVPDRAMVPEKPFVLDSVTVVVAVEPWATFSEVGLALTLKSGVFVVARTWNMPCMETGWIVQ